MNVQDVFGVNPCADGHEVIALDTGRPVTGPRTQRSAQGTARILNSAARHSSHALRHGPHADVAEDEAVMKL